MAKFRDAAGVDDPSQIWVGLVDRDGKVYWTARGPAAGDDQRDALRSAVRRVASPQAE